MILKVFPGPPTACPSPHPCWPLPLSHRARSAQALPLCKFSASNLPAGPTISRGDAYEEHFLLPGGKVLLVTNKRVALLQAQGAGRWMVLVHG